MYVRRGISAGRLFRGSWPFLLGASIWSAIVVYLNEYLGLHFLSIPVTPITVIGIAVSLYLGFKSTSAYNRWWEARTIWGGVINRSRDWGSSVLNLIHAEGREPDPAIRAELIERHLAWVNALAYQLRASSRFMRADPNRLFGRRIAGDERYHQTRACYRRFLSEAEIEAVEKKANVATELLRRQGDRLRALVQEGFLDSYRQVAMMGILAACYDMQGACERIKNTPFPRQIANFGLMFTWVFIFLLPLAFVDIFESETDLHGLSASMSLEYVLVMIPFTVLISWVFFIMEKVSDSTKDPFEGAATDVPISSLCRVIEIDLRQMMDAEDVPEPLKPAEGVLY